MKKVTHGFSIRAGHPAAILSMLAFALCVPAQILGYLGALRDPLVAVTLVSLPVLSALLMIVVILKTGRGKLWLSIFPVFIGVLGFAFKLALDPRAKNLSHHVAASVLYCAIVVLWALTVLYVIKTKWILTGLFLFPFFKHVFVNDLPVLLGKAAPVPASVWLKELSMLFFMLALSLCAFSFEKWETDCGAKAAATSD